MKEISEDTNYWLSILNNQFCEEKTALQALPFVETNLEEAADCRLEVYIKSEMWKESGHNYHKF